MRRHGIRLERNNASMSPTDRYLAHIGSRPSFPDQCAEAAGAIAPLVASIAILVHLYITSAFNMQGYL